MNTANLQLAGLCLALDGICKSLIASGALPRDALLAALDRAEATALAEPRALSDANRDAICFPIRALRAGLADPQSTASFADLASRVGREKPERTSSPGGTEPTDVMAKADHMTEDEHLIAARTIEAERDA
ncbi:MAG: hypothetical protein ACO1OK_13140 [Devosia sp.]